MSWLSAPLAERAALSLKQPPAWNCIRGHSPAIQTARRLLLPTAEVVQGDVEDLSTLTAAVAGIDAVIFAHGSDNDARPDAFERIDYGGVANVLRALDGRRPRIVLQSTFFVTHRDHYFNDGGHALDWKRRAERLVRASGAPHTIVRPGWLDQTAAGDDAVDLKQGDRSEAGVSRQQVAETIVRSLLTDAAIGKTFELFATPARRSMNGRHCLPRSNPTLQARSTGSTILPTFP